LPSNRSTCAATPSLFAIRNWKDDSGVDANEFSGWARSYANYLEEYVVNMMDIPPMDKTSNGGGGSAASATAMRSYNEADLMNKLPRVQQMMRRLLDCEAVNEHLTANEVVIGATSLLLKDSFKLYRMVGLYKLNAVDP
jgi:hypothetical protein